MYSEKITDYNMLSAFKKVFNTLYNTSGNLKLFGSKIPDGWFEYTDNLFIIENKKNLKDKRDGLKQLLNYYLIASKTEEFKKYKQCFLILGCGTSKDFKYWIYSMDNNNIKETKYKLKDLKTKDYKPSFDLKEIHEFNQYLYNCGINLPKNQKTLFVAAILLCLKVNPDFMIEIKENNKEFNIANKIIEIIRDYYKDLIFAKSFEFIKYNLNNEQLFYLINIVSIDIKKYGIDILKQFYNEFMIYDKNNDSKIGVVLTPHDIVELMVKSLNIKKGESVADFCTGTGSFLVEASKYTNNLIGCENGEERYALAKCNFILKDLSIEHLYFNNCFNQQFESYDHIILNPPFSCNSSDNGEIEDLYGWRKLKNEQKFVIYQLQYLKDGGIGCCIIPRSNFNNSTSKSNNFKKILLDNCQIIKIINCNSKVFAPAANVECTICVFKKCKSSNFESDSKRALLESEIIDYSDDGYTVKKNIRLKTSEPNPKSYKTVLKLNEDWNYVQSLDIPDDLEYLIKTYNLNYSYCQEKLKIEQNKYNVKNNLADKEIITVKLKDLIKPIKIKTYTFDKCENGSIPFYVASQMNIPKGFKNVVSVDCEQLGLKQVLCINTSGEGVIGYCHLRSGKFAVNGIVSVFEMLQDITIENLTLLQYYLIKRFNHHFEHFSFNLSEDMEIKQFKNYKEEYEFNKLKYIKENFKIKEWKKIKISDYFDIVKPKKIFKISQTEDGEYPLISSTSLNNGTTKYINDYSIELNECLTIARNGSVGYCFYQTGKFGITTDIIIIKLKENLNLDLKLFSVLTTYYLTKKYNYSNKISIDKLKNEIINYPLFE